MQPQEATARLQAVAEIKRYQHWLTPTLKIIPKSWWNFVRHIFEKINLPQSRRELLAIRVLFVRSRDETMVVLYNRAVKAFNQFAPEHKLDMIFPEKLKQLNNECLRPAVATFKEDLLTRETKCPEAEIKEYCKETYQSYELYEDTIREFENKGGKVIPLSKLKDNERYEACLGLRNQLIIPVCQAGLFRSPVITLSARCLKQINGYPRSEVRAQHGFSKGLDSPKDLGEGALATEFQLAFGVERSQRFGADILEELHRNYDTDIQSVFQKEFYQFQNGNVDKVFIVFSEAGEPVLRRLLEANKSDYWHLRNVTVVMIPEGDWIAPARIKHWDLLKETNPTRSIHELSNQQRRELFFALTDEAPFPRHLLPLLDYLQGLNITAEAWRTAYWKWSGLFQPITIPQKDFYSERLNALAYNIQGASRKEILQQKEWFFNEEKHLLAFNRVAKKFNDAFPEEQPIEPVLSQFFKRLCEKWIAAPVRSFPSNALTQKKTVREEELTAFSMALQRSSVHHLLNEIRIFESCGGRIVLVPALAHQEDRYPPIIGISKNTYVKPVCHMGLVRSQGLAQIALAIKRKLGCEFGKENVALPHGVLDGYDWKSSSVARSWGPDSEHDHYSLLPRAFGVLRQDRFGKKEWDLLRSKNKFTAETFENRYYRDTQEEIVYLTVADTGRDILLRLMETHLKSDNNVFIPVNDLFKNITIVMIPEGDWISTNYVYPNFAEALLQLWEKATSVRDLTEEEERRVFFLVNGKATYCPADDALLRNYAGKYFPDAGTGNYAEWSVSEHFKSVAYRLAFRRWSGLFVPLET